MEPAAGREALLAGFLQHADLVVQGVVGLLVLGSVASWAIILAKTMRVAQFGRSLRRIEDLARDPGRSPQDPDGLMRALLAARDAERAEGQAPAEVRARRAAAMRAAGLAALRASEGGLPFLATLAATAPFGRHHGGTPQRRQGRVAPGVEASLGPAQHLGQAALADA